ncbi:MAG: bifunctional biotin--[acetyl-CoA-carboxylase] ligase/biotin operon repressor BirA [Gammaproteobacteria bacterium]
MLRYRLVELLSDGQFRSGEWLGQQLGVSRAAVWKRVRDLSELGLDVHAVQGQGYRLAQPFEPLHAHRIHALLAPHAAAHLDALDVFHEIDSTSDHLKRAASSCPLDRARVCLAEWQTAGRGRRGRRWISPYGSNLYLSLAWQLTAGALQAGGLSLMVAVAVLRALHRCGAHDLGLKWPNDIFYRGRKLAGILLDVSGESAGPFLIVIGVGVNVRLPENAARSIDQPWADLWQAGLDVDRNALAAQILEALLEALVAFAREGLAAFAAEWERYDVIAGRTVELHQDRSKSIRGVARGIDSHGALLLEQDGVTRSFHAGEISVRLTQ